MGTMSSPDCEHFRGLIALDAIDKATEAERLGLGAHLEGCRDCREDDRELKNLSTMLAVADLGRLEHEEMPAGLHESVLRRLHSEARSERRARRTRYVVGGVAAAAAVCVALALSLSGGTPSGSGTSRTLALTGERGVHASVQLTPEAWGTSVRVDESGQPGNQVLWVSMRTESGTWWATGTYRTVAGRAVQVELACALKLEDIRSVWIKDSAGHVLLHGYVD